MTANVDIVNRALQVIGSRTTVTAAELANSTTNEAIQANLILAHDRDSLLRMAPWNCGTNYASLVLVTALPGTPENQSAATSQWQKGQPAPPWLYEYQYPVDCMKPMFIVPQLNTGFAGLVPISPVTVVAPYFNGPVVKYKVGVDQFFPVTAATVAAGGTGYAVGDEITLAETPAGTAPIGAPVKLLVATLSGSAVATVTVVSQIQGSSPNQGGSYFAVQTNPVAQSATTGSGTGATFNLTFGSKGDQRIILTNQEDAILAYVKQVTDPNVMDDLFVDAWVDVLGGHLAIPLTGDKALANMRLAMANNTIEEARKADANEGITVNDITPDWIRARGYSPASDLLGPSFASVDWGGLWPLYT